MFNNTSYLKTNYLLNCDYINKYNLKTIYKKPYIKDIVIHYSLNNLIKAYDFKSVTENSSELQIKASLLLYFFSSSIPFITSSKIKKNVDKNGESNYSVKIILSNKKIINNFLSSLFIESTNNIDLNTISKNQKKVQEKFNTFMISVPAQQIYDFNNILDYNILGINSKDFEIKISFKFFSPLKDLNFIKTIKNLPLFWTNN